MFHKDNPEYKRNQVCFYSLDLLVPADHFLRQVEEVVDFSFIYDVVEDTYSSDMGRTSLDPVLLVKIPLIQCFYGIRSMRQTIKDIEVNVAYRWFLGLTLDDKVPHFTTYGKNYSRRFQEKGLIERLFETAKEYHNLRYTRQIGKLNMEDKVGLTLACLNIKKLVKIRAGRPFYFALFEVFLTIFLKILTKTQKKTNPEVSLSTF